MKFPSSAGAGLCFAISSWCGCAPLDDLSSYSIAPDAGTYSNAESPAVGAIADAGGSAPAQNTEEPVNAMSNGSLDGTPSTAAPSEGGGPEPGHSTPLGDAGVAEGAPKILQSQPSNGQRGVAPDASIIIDFDRAMDTLSVAEGLRLEGPSVPELILDWSRSNQRLTIGFAAPLAMATGPDPNELAALNYRLVLQDARDEAGVELPATLLNFSTLRRIRVTLDALATSDMTGNWRSDDIYGTNPCDTAGNRICVGDSSLGVNERYSGFATFDLSRFAARDAQQLEAELQLSVAGLLGAPFSDLGAMLVEEVAFSSIGPSAFSAPTTQSVGRVQQASNPELVRLNVVAAAATSGVFDSTLQLRFRFETATDSDGATDLVFLDREQVRVDLSYWVP